MKSSIDLYTEHIWLFLDTYKEFDYTDITFLPPGTILRFSVSDGKDKGYGRISHSKPIESHDYCLVDVVWNRTTWISKSGGAIDLFCINSGDIIQVCGYLSLQWKKILDALKEGEKEIKKTFKSIDKLVEYDEIILHHDIAMDCLESSIERYLSEIKEDLYIRLILSHRKDKPRPYP